MVQSYQSPVRVYKYPFELVMAAYVRRFPTCEMIPIMASTEIVSQTESEDGAIEEISRRCKLHIEAPYLLKKLMGVEHVLFIQTNTLDRRSRTLTIKAYNESFSSRVIINENCKYSVHPENTQWTCFEQNASLDVKSFFGFENTVEKIAMKQYSLNISKGKEIIEHFIDELKNEGITFVQLWHSPKLGRKSSQKESSDDELNFSSTDSTDLHVGASASNLPNKVDKLKIHEDTLSKLDCDYISRCVGNLTPLQESRLVQLKKCIMQLQKGKVPSDTTLLRFLKARDFNLEKSREMLSQSLIWRKKNQIDKLLSEYQTPQVIHDYFPGGWHHTDKDGRPLFLLRLGQMDVKGLIKSVGEEGILMHTLHICEEGLRLTSEATANLGTPVTTWTLLVDLEGLNMRHLWRPGVRTLLKIIELVENNYPETMEHVLIIRAPRVFPILWTLISTFIDENTRSKFLFYGGNDYQDSGGLIDFMVKDFIPDFLGGCCKTAVQEGGLVPKTMYLPGEEIEGGRHLILAPDQSIYESVSLARGQVHEAVMLIEEAGAVICWDFDVMKCDVMFSVLRTKVPITNRQEPPNSPTGALGVIETVIGSDDQHKSVIEKVWREGHEYFLVEPTQIFHDGESVQGSHVTSHMGTYLLQWKYYDLPTHSALDIIDSFTAPKAKIMYFYETLKSSDYKGSMSSLQSGQSGFSCLSSNTAKSSSCASR